MVRQVQPKTQPSPSDPSPRWQVVPLPVSEGETVIIQDDSYSDRIRCDHPSTTDGARLGKALLKLARERGRARIVVLAPSVLHDELEACGLAVEAVMPGFYQGRDACYVMGRALTHDRIRPRDEEANRRVDALLAERPAPKERAATQTKRAEEGDAAAIAQLIAECFEFYPTPSGVAGYIAEEIHRGVPFRIVEEEGLVIACATADLVREAETAELTDCATHPERRGRGLMQSILGDLMDDLRAMGYPTAFTLCRASVAGMNLAFQRLGFEWRGRMIQSCRIGAGIEDMNVWSRRLDSAPDSAAWADGRRGAGS